MRAPIGALCFEDGKRLRLLLLPRLRGCGLPGAGCVLGGGTILPGLAGARSGAWLGLHVGAGLLVEFAPGFEAAVGAGFGEGGIGPGRITTGGVALRVGTLGAGAAILALAGGVEAGLGFALRFIGQIETGGLFGLDEAQKARHEAYGIGVLQHLRGLSEQGGAGGALNAIQELDGLGFANLGGGACCA